MRSVSRAEANFLRDRQPVPGWSVCPTYPVFRTPQAAGRVVDGLAEPDGLDMFEILRLDSDQLIGDASAERGRVRTDTVWTFIEIAEAVQRKGYGAEALRALSSWAGAQEGVKCVRAETLAVKRSVAAHGGASWLPTQRGSTDLGMDGVGRCRYRRVGNGTTRPGHSPRFPHRVHIAYRPRQFGW